MQPVLNIWLVTSSRLENCFFLFSITLILAWGCVLIIHFAVTAHENTNVVGRRVWRIFSIKKHAECFFKQNLKTNSAAVKQYQESLSPEKKSNFMQWCWRTQKNWESLPPEKKVKNLQTNADTHKEKRESLSPEDKDLFVKNNVAAQHKHLKPLSPDQKAQEITINASEHKKTPRVSIS